jgi:hypothetical protein
MADIFISYSKQAPHYTRDLAQRLEIRGFTVWWDTELLPGDKFHDKIRDEITGAKVVIVIWSPASVESAWVQAEARMASAQNKLLTVCTPDLDASRVPMPFNMLHIEKIGDHDKLISAFAARGLHPRDEAKARLAQRGEECIRLAEKCYHGDGQPIDMDQAITVIPDGIRSHWIARRP